MSKASELKTRLDNDFWNCVAEGYESDDNIMLWSDSNDQEWIVLARRFRSRWNARANRAVSGKWRKIAKGAWPVPTVAEAHGMRLAWMRGEEPQS